MVAGPDVKLKVAEAIQDDVNKGIVRLDSSYMRELDIRPGNIVEIKGDRATVAIADRSLPGDIGLNIIRMDGLIRRNAHTTIGEQVKVKKAEVHEAKKVTIAPARSGIMIRANPQIFKRGLLGRAVLKGDIVGLGGTKRRKSAMSDNPFFNDMDLFSSMLNDSFTFGLGDLKFVVVDVQPAKGAVLVTENTDVVFNPEAVEMKEESSASDVSYEDIGGLDEELSKVREMVELPLRHPEIFERLGVEPPKGVLLHGPPGTGKTLLAKAVANETQSNFILINGPEIMSKYYGQSEENLRKKFEEAEKDAPSIIFIDEIDAIASKREESKGEVERRVVAQLLAIMDGLKSRGKVVVIAATNIPNQLDPALRRPGRFDREIEIGVPGVAGRLNILKIHTRNMPLDKSVDLNRLAAVTHGFVGADLSSLAKEAAMIVLRRLLPDLNLKEDEEIPKEVLEKLFIKQKDFVDALKVVRPSAMREVLVQVPDVKWDDIGGLEDVKQELMEAVEWPLKHKDAFIRLGVKPPKGVLLYGPPGTGKTLLAKAVANESEANFILVKGPEMLSKWVGESEKAVRKIFEKARQTSPTIIFFDEFDSIAPRRGGQGNGTDSNVTERVVNQLLTEMDGLQELQDIVIIAATNRPDIIDTALLRPGRFDRIILAPVPDRKTRKKIFELHTKGMKLGKDVEIGVLTERTDGYVGADIEAVCREAAIMALRKDIKAKEVTMEFFDQALNKVQPSTTKEIEDAYKELEGHFRSAQGARMKDEKPSYYG
ncbi:CDC48 family AAA ATPase [Candidatus Woesearchaeota archaeon]|nr:CDC48 family AAA ATPase [Candidatus Woesearchaeota archaeon]